MIQLLIRIAISLIVSIYYISRFKIYIENNKNNNITGDVLFRWESVSIIDKYHLRERFLPGSRLRIKRDAKRREIKYYWLTFVFAALFVLESYYVADTYSYVFSTISLLIIIKILFDRIERKLSVPKFMICLILFWVIVSAYVLVLAGIVLPTDNNTDSISFVMNGKITNISPVIAISSVITALILLFSIIKKRFLSLMICICVIIATLISLGLTIKPGVNNYYMICNTGCLYISLIIMQLIYNIRALKKITFIN